MVTIIAGSRHLKDLWIVQRAILLSQFEITKVVSGAAPGVDSLGERWALENKIPVVRFPANWRDWGKQAGPMRNEEMAVYASSQPCGGALIAVPFNQSRGTMNMIATAKSYGLQVYVHRMHTGKPKQVGFDF